MNKTLVAMFGIGALFILGCSAENTDSVRESRANVMSSTEILPQAESSRAVATSLYRYEISDLGASPIGRLTVSAEGAAAGSLSGQTGGQAVVWPFDGGPVVSLPRRNGDYYAYVNAVNNQGWVAGETGVDDTDYGVAALWSPSHELFSLGTLGRHCSIATGINDRVQVVGELCGDVPPDGHWRTEAFYWLPGSGFHLFLEGTPGMSGSTASAVNNRGQIVGTISYTDGPSRAFLWNEGDLKLLGTLGGASYAVALNESSEVAGYYEDGRDESAFVWRSNEGIRRLEKGSFQSTRATAINNAGVVVGFGYNNRDYHTERALLWDSKGGWADMNAYIDPNGGWELNRVAAINDAGVIVGTGKLNGLPHAFRATPVVQSF